MATITTRAGKGSPLTNNELDANFTAINDQITSNRPSIRPSLLLDFQYTKQLDPRITFSRPTTATYYDGKTVVKAEENLLVRSQEFDNSAWGKENVTITANSAQAPDGTSTAYALIETTSTAQHYVTQAISLAGGVYTFSAYIKANTRTTANLFLNSIGSGVAYIDLSAGTIAVTTGPAVASGAIISIGNGWYRCSITTNSISASTGYFVVGIGNPASYIGDGTSGIYIWGAQLEQRSSVTAYTPTTTAPITNYIPALQTAVSNDARFDHDPVTGESKGLLIEEQRSNLLTYSNQFDNAAWTKGASNITLNTVVSPNGTLTGSKLVEDTATSAHSVFQTFTTVNGTAYTLSFYIKKAERTFALIAVGLTTPAAVSVNLTTGVATSANGSPTNISSVSVGNEWYRVSFSFVGNGSSVNLLVYASQDGVWANRSYTGDGYSGIYIWGAQLEAGSFPTSYIPTVASQVTRSADSASMTGSNFSSWYRADEGTLYGELSYSGVSASVWVYPITLSDGTAGNTIAFRRYGAGALVFRIDSGSASQCSIGSVTPADGVFTKMAAAYAVNDFSLSTNGGAVATDTFGSVPACNSLYLGVPAGVFKYFNGYIKRIAYYPKRLTNTELQGLTS